MKEEDLRRRSTGLKAMPWNILARSKETKLDDNAHHAVEQINIMAPTR
jgi:hypothetical protein